MIFHFVGLFFSFYGFAVVIFYSGIQRRSAFYRSCDIDVTRIGEVQVTAEGHSHCFKEVVQLSVIRCRAVRGKIFTGFVYGHLLFCRGLNAPLRLCGGCGLLWRGYEAQRKLRFGPLTIAYHSAVGIFKGNSGSVFCEDFFSAFNKVTSLKLYFVSRLSEDKDITDCFCYDKFRHFQFPPP